MIPEFLKESLLKDYSEEEYSSILAGYNSNRPVTIRINNLKSNKENILNILKEHHINYQEVSWYENALILSDINEEQIRELDIYQKGHIYLQSLSSQLPPLFLEPKENDQILDMTAAPGGKTTEIAALTNNTVMITATEKNKQRFERLKYNLEKQGVKKATVIQKDARFLDDFFSFDKIILDAPCSGSGTLTKETLASFQEELVTRINKAQEELLEKALKLIKKDGYVIYSTCSILKQENEELLNKFIKANKIEIIPLDLSNYKDLPLLKTNIPGTLCVCPNNLYEGFFIAKIRKVV
jgi:NOL1/NOP2/sun family putative RNA methylase